MNILLINHYAGSPEYGMEFRPYYLAKEWTKSGHNVTIIAASFSHLRTKQPSVNEQITSENVDGINYVWIKTPPYDGNGLSRIKNMLTFVRMLSKNAKYLAEKYKPDAIIASSTYPVDTKPAYKIAKLANVKLVFEIHDLWPLSPMELGGYSKFHPFIAWLQYYENFAYKYSNEVVSILPKTQEHTKNHGLHSFKWHHIPNGIVVEDWKNAEKIPETYKSIIDKLKNNDKILIGYAGGHAISNSLKTLVEAAKLLKNNHKFHFILVGDGNEKDNLQKQAQDLNNITFLSSINKKSVPDLLSYFDILFIGWNRSPLYRFGISPNKIFDYMMAKKPIIHAVEAGNDIVKDANAGLSIEPENPQAIAEAIGKMANLSKKELKEMGENGYNYVVKNNDYSILADKFLEILKN